MIQYLTDNQWLLWLVIAAACLIMELVSFDFFVTCFAIGALFAALVSLLDPPFWVQVLVFAVCAVISLRFVRPVLQRHLHRHDSDRVSNADALMGREGMVVEPIAADGYGYVKIDGDEWRAVSSDGEPIEKGVKVKVIARESIVITVERVES